MTVTSSVKSDREHVSIIDRIQGILSNRIIIYVIRRILIMVPLFLGISILTFVMVRAIGSPEDLQIGSGTNNDAVRQQIRDLNGLDEPYHIQYLIWIKNFFTWEFGYSGVFKTDNVGPKVNRLIIETAKLQYSAIFFSVMIAIPLGVIAATKRGKPEDTLASSFALLGLSMPIYVSGIGLIYIFGGANLGWFPGNGSKTAFRDEAKFSNLFDLNGTSLIYDSSQIALFLDNIQDSLNHLVLPLIALTFIQLALITRLLRSSMLEVLGQDYILAARANGLDERTIIWRHALRNAIIPVITFIGLSLGTALAGAPITETVFAWPGLGRIYIRAIFNLDMSLVLGITMIITIMILISNLLTDIMYVIIDPRITI